MQRDLILKYQNCTGTGKKEAPPKKKLILDGETGALPANDTLSDSDEVSEPDSVLSMDSSEADAYIDDSNNVNDSTAPTNVKDNTLDAIIVEEYNEEQILPRLPPIDAKLAVVVTKWLRNLPSRGKVKDLFKNCMLPNNAEGLQPAKINVIVVDKLNAN